MRPQCHWGEWKNVNAKTINDNRKFQKSLFGDSSEIKGFQLANHQNILFNSLHNTDCTFKIPLDKESVKLGCLLTILHIYHRQKLYLKFLVILSIENLTSINT